MRFSSSMQLQGPELETDTFTLVGDNTQNNVISDDERFQQVMQLFSKDQVKKHGHDSNRQIKFFRNK
jgi:hypothetical protein